MRTYASRPLRATPAPARAGPPEPPAAAERGLGADAELRRAEAFGHRFEHLAPAGAPPAAAPGGLSLQGFPIQRGKKKKAPLTKEGGEQRQQERAKLTAATKKKQHKRILNRTDYLLDPHGFPLKPQPGLATSEFFTAAREALGATPPAPPGPIPLDTSTPASQAQGVLSLAATFTADRSTPVPATTSGGTPVGELSKSSLPWFKIPGDASHGAGEPSGFAKPVDAGNKKQRTTYEKNAGIFSATKIGSADPVDQAHRLLVSGSEAVRGPGAGLGQVLAETTRGAAGIGSRDDLFGKTKSPGYLPGGYKGSQADIVLTEDLAAAGEHARVLQNPTGLQTEEVLAVERRQRFPPLTRSLSLPESTASRKHYRRETEEVFDKLGLKDRLKRQRDD